MASHLLETAVPPWLCPSAPVIPGGLISKSWVCRVLGRNVSEEVQELESLPVPRLPYACPQGDKRLPGQQPAPTLIGSRWDLCIHRSLPLWLIHEHLPGSACSLSPCCRGNHLDSVPCLLPAWPVSHSILPAHCSLWSQKNVPRFRGKKKKKLDSKEWPSQDHMELAVR